MKKPTLKIAAILLLAFTASGIAAAGEDDLAASSCKTGYGDISGRLELQFARSVEEMAEKLSSGHDLALLQYSPNPLAAHPEWAELAPMLATEIGKSGSQDLMTWPEDSFKSLVQGILPFLKHHKALRSDLHEKRRFPYSVKGALKDALFQQLLWTLNNPRAAQVPPLKNFLHGQNEKKVIALYRSQAGQYFLNKAPVPVSRTGTDYFAPQVNHQSPLTGAPKEVIEMARKFTKKNPLESVQFTNWAKSFLNAPHAAAETVIEDLVHDLTRHYESREPWYIALKTSLDSGEITEAELAAYLAFYLPELTLQVHIAKARKENFYLEKYLESGADTANGRPSYTYAGSFPWASHEAAGWNVRNPEMARPTELALAYLRGEKQVRKGITKEVQPKAASLAAVPVADATYMEPSTSAVALRAKPSRQPAPPRAIPVDFILTPMPRLEAWPHLTFEASASHDFATAADALMLAHLDIAGSLRSAQIQFRALEEKSEQPALRQVEAFLGQKEQKLEDFPAALEAVKDLLALNAAKLKHLEDLKADSAELLDHMQLGLQGMKSLLEQLPSTQGANPSTLDKIHAVLETQRALDRVAKNAESVDRTLRELNAQVFADKATLTNVVQILGNPITFPNTPRRPLIESLEALAKDGH